MLPITTMAMNTVMITGWVMRVSNSASTPAASRPVKSPRSIFTK